MTDVVLITLPAWVVWDLRTKWTTKLIVISAFAWRLAYVHCRSFNGFQGAYEAHRLVAAQISRLIFFRRLKLSSDPIHDALLYQIATQLQTTLSVVVTCIPALKPFLDRAFSGMMAASLRRGSGTYRISDSFARESPVKSPRRGFKRSNTEYRSTGKDLQRSGDSFWAHLADITDHRVVISSPKRVLNGGVGRVSCSRPDGMKIQRTVDLKIDYGDGSSRSSYQHQQQWIEESDNAPLNTVHARTASES